MPRVAIYCRLSDEDREKASPDDFSESIQNQKNMLTMYSLEKGWEIYRIYCDDDFSGADEDRPEYNRLLRDAEKGCFEVVLCKTQSRFTRDLSHLEKYVHTCFPEWGIRFIGLIDHADTDLKGNKKARQINGLINEWYLEDLSDNVTSVLNSKKKLGKFIGAFAPYGYQKDPRDKNHLIADPEAALIVRRIFRMYLEGNSLRKIASMLNEEDVPSPLRYKQEVQGCRFQAGGAGCGNQTRWTDSSVHMILGNQMYIGDMVQNKSKKISYKKKTVRRLKREEWVIVPGTHEAIIEREDFEKARELAGRKMHPDRNGKVSKFAGKLKCAYCGRNLSKRSARGKVYYYCGNAQRGGDCRGSGIAESVLEALVAEEIRKHIRRYIRFDDLIPILETDSGSVEANLLEKHLRKAKKSLSGKEEAVVNLYQDKVAGVISEDQFIMINQLLIADRDRLLQTIRTYECRLNAISELSGAGFTVDTMEEEKEGLRRYLEVRELTRSMIIELIDCIFIENLAEKDEKRVEIHWEF